MNIDTISLGMDVLTIALLLVVLIFALGIVWRVEKKLDWSYKLFVLAAGSIVLADVLDLSAAHTDWKMIFLGKGLRLIGAVLFLMSVLCMRDIVRMLDHEKDEPS